PRMHIQHRFCASSVVKVWLRCDYRSITNCCATAPIWGRQIESVLPCAVLRITVEQRMRRRVRLGRGPLADLRGVWCMVHQTTEDRLADRGSLRLG
ncbi:MAG: hypothetical protein WBL15_18965, partial [Phycisphaerae bacterium]